MFSEILIANRGEIACRVIRTARQVGIAALTVFSATDAHVPLSDKPGLTAMTVAEPMAVAT